MLHLIIKNSISRALRGSSRFYSSANLVADKNSGIVSESRAQQIINADLKNNLVVPVFKKALAYGQKVALKDGNGEFTYNNLAYGALRLSRLLAETSGTFKR